MTGETTVPVRSAKDAWDGRHRWWSAYYAVVLTATMVYSLADEGSTAGKAIAVALLAAMVPWYVFLGRSVILNGEFDRRSYLYVAGLAALVAAAAVAQPASSLVLFAVCPQCFMTLRWGRGVVAVLVLNAIPVGGVLYESGDSAEAVDFAFWGVVIVAFSAAFGLWIERIITQSAERRELIEELKATRTELAEANREAGTMAERERLAGEIHDTLAQGFTSILMLLQAADAVLDQAPDQARHQIDLATRTARENLAEARTLVAALAPVRLESSSLDEAIGRLADRLGEELDLTTSYEVEGTPRPLGPGTEVVLLRTAQEALANVRKHAKAETVTVRLAYDAETVRLEVGDDGKGFDPETADGFGLHGARDRAARLSGWLSVRSAPGAGTTLTIEAPVQGGKAT